VKEAYRKYLQEGEAAGSRYTLHFPQEIMKGDLGARVGRMAGASIDFKDYREYQPGDDVRTIDWNVYGRTDRLTVKLFHEEVNPHLDLILDASRSMALPDTAKERALLGLGALLAISAGNAGASCTAYQAGDGVEEIQNGSGNPSGWDGIVLDHTAGFAEAYALRPARWRRNGMRMLISDLLWAGDPMFSLGLLAGQSSGVIVVQLMAREDVSPTMNGNMRLSDIEGGEYMETFVDSLALDNYRNALARHQGAWHEACRRVGAQMVTVVAEDLVAGWRLPGLEKTGILGAG
jgi:uncharacterized protein (DUF58 family)